MGTNELHPHFVVMKEWLIINIVVNYSTRITLPSFYIFRGERIHDDYI
jgi:hypothetical protein